MHGTNILTLKEQSISLSLFFKGYKEHKTTYYILLSKIQMFTQLHRGKRGLK